MGDGQEGAVDDADGSLGEGKRAQETGDGQGGLKDDAAADLAVVTTGAGTETPQEAAAPQGGVS